MSETAANESMNRFVMPDYEFFDGARRIKLSDLFEDGKPYLFMYHVMQRANIVAASLAPAPRRPRRQASHQRLHVIVRQNAL